jgi:hypothetical protein
MKAQNFYLALDVLREHHSNEIIINKSFGHSSNTGSFESPTIHITGCVGAVIKELISLGFLLSMEDGFTSVNDYGTVLPMAEQYNNIKN